MSQEIDDEQFSLEQNEEDENYRKFRKSIDSMVSRRATKYKNYSHPCLQKSAEELVPTNSGANPVSDYLVSDYPVSQVAGSQTSDHSASYHSASDYLVSDHPISHYLVSDYQARDQDSGADPGDQVSELSVGGEQADESVDPASNSVSRSAMDSLTERNKTAKDASKEAKEYRVIHRPPLPPSTSSKLIHSKPSQFSEFQVKPPNFVDIIDNILSSNTNIREYLRELRKNSELDYLLLSKILEKTLVPKANVYVQTEPISVRSVETNTLSPAVSQKQTQTRESRILSYKLLETENLFEKLKIQSNFANSNYEIKRTSDLKLEEECGHFKDHYKDQCKEHYKDTEYANGDQPVSQTTSRHFESSKSADFRSSSPGKHQEAKHCSCSHEKTTKAEDKYRDRIHLWNNLLQVDTTSEFSEDNSTTCKSENQTSQSAKQETISENQSSTLSDDDQFSVSTRKSRKSYSSIKSTKSVKSTKSTKSIKSIKDELLGEREIDLIERYKRIKDFKLKYECEKKEFIELRKQFKSLKKKLAREAPSKRTIEFDDYHQPVVRSETSYLKERNTFKEQIREQKRISFNDEQSKYQTRFECEEQFELPVYETSVADESESTVFEGAKDDESYLTDSEYSVLENQNQNSSQNNVQNQNQHNSASNRPDSRSQRVDKSVEFIDQDELDRELDGVKNLHRSVTNVNSQQGAVKTESKILIETTNLKKKEISEISSQTELTKEGMLSRKTQVTNVKKVPVLVPIDGLQYADSSQFSSPTQFDRSPSRYSGTHQRYNTKTPEPIITSPTSTAAATPSATPSATPQRKSRKKHRSNTIEIHSVTPSTTNCSRPTSAIDLNDEAAQNGRLNGSPPDHYRTSKLPNQPKGKFFTNSYSEGELNAMKKDKHCILNEQLNFGISEPFMAYDSTIYDEEKQTKRSKIYSENQMPSAKALKMSLQRKPASSKRLMENSNLQQIVEWQETNSSTITNEINSEPFRCLDGNSRPAKTVSLTTETTLQNKGNERTIETKSKAIRKFDVNKENQSKDDRTDGPNKQAEHEEETSFNPPGEPTDKCNKCHPNDHEIKKKSSNKSSRSKPERRMKAAEKMYPGDPSVCVRNVNLNLLPGDLFNPLADYKRLSGDNYLRNYVVDTTDTIEAGSEKSNQNDNLSKLSFDSGHSSSMSSISYQNKPNGHLNNHSNVHSESTIQESNLDDLDNLEDRLDGSYNRNLNEILDDLNDDLNPLNSTDLANEETEIKCIPDLSDDEQANKLSLAKPSIDEFSKSLLPKVRSSNLSRNTEIINRITKTVYPESIKKKTIKKKKFVFEQQLNSPSNDQEQNDCKISSLITMEIPCNLRRKSRCSKCHKSRKLAKYKEAGEETTSEYYESTSFQPEADRHTATSLSSACSSSETDSLFNEEDLNTLTKFQKFKPVLIDQDDEQTTWEYSLECNCLNGVNASVKTTVTQFHQKNKTSAPFLDAFQNEQLT